MVEAIVTAVSRGIELGGIATMVIGFALSAILALVDVRSRTAAEIYRATRERIGKSILLGLELLVAADILRTISEVPTLERVAVLAAIVGIRTFLSFALEIELSGRVPWRDAESK